MLLLMILASFAAETLAISSGASKSSSTIKLSTFIKSPAPNKTITSIKFASLSTTKRKKSFITPLLAAVSPALKKKTNKKPSPLVESSSLVTRNRIVPPAAKIDVVIHNSFNRKKPSDNKPLVVSIVAATENLLKSPAYDDDEPEDLKNLPNSNNIYPIEPGNKPSNRILSEIKTKLQQGNDDYLDKLSGRRQADEVIARPKIVDAMRYEHPEPIKNFIKKDRYTPSQNMTHTDNAKFVINSAESRFLKVNRYLRRSGVTTPSPYEIKPYRKHKIHKNRKHADTRRARHHRHGHRAHDRLAKRRHEVGLKTENNVVTNPLLIPSESAETTPTNKDHMVQPITKLPSTLRPHSHQTTTPASIATRPTEYETSTSSTTTKETLPYWIPTTETKASPHAHRAKVVKVDKKGSHDKGHVDKSIWPSLTTLNAVEIKSEKKQKKLERFVKFINKNRVLLREFIAKKKSSKAVGRAGTGFFRGRNDRVHLHAHQLDLSPGKGNKLEQLRAKGRLCQRNIMIPEGPKYDSMGSTYMPEFKHVKGHPDYPATKKKRFLIPACCNCCKKSVLGCE